MKKGIAYIRGEIAMRAGLITASRLHVSISRQCRLPLQTVRLHLKKLHYRTFFLLCYFRARSLPRSTAR